MDIKAVRRGRSGTVMALVVVLAGVLGLLAMPSAQASGTGATTGAIAVNGAGFGHGVGMSLWERPIFSKRFKGQDKPLKEGMVFALETWKGSNDGSGAARIEEEVVVTKNGCEIITNYPSDHLISCGLPGCEVVG